MTTIMNTVTKTRIKSLDDNGLVYNCSDKFSIYELVLSHKFSEVNTKIDEFSYYITVNGNREDSNIYQPELVSREKDEDFYISVYRVELEYSKNSSDSIKLNLILPFDHKTNILNLTVYGSGHGFEGSKK